MAKPRSADVLRAMQNLAAAATTMAEAFLAGLGLLLAAVNRAVALHSNTAVLDAELVALRVGSTSFGDAFALAAVASAPVTGVDLIVAVFLNALASMLVECTFGRIGQCSIRAKVEFAMRRHVDN
ncbi:hypothetical protein LEN26_019639 [Aphanomyces euteiches]|nr:hypothetical protein LEN26_019639 [Aphanomyces euteiches]